MTTDHNEALSQLPHKLATLIRSLPQAPFRNHLSAECVKQAERIAELEARVHTCGPTCSKAGCINRRFTAELKSARAETTRIIALLDAANDERKALRAEVERLRKTDAEILACNYPDGEENGPTVAAPDFDLICFARQLGIIDTARKATQ